MLKVFNIKKCDYCNAINPRCLYGNPRLCAECATPTGGFYHRKGDALGTNGKIKPLYIRLPFAIKFRSLFY